MSTPDLRARPLGALAIALACATTCVTSTACAPLIAPQRRPAIDARLGFVPVLASQTSIEREAAASSDDGGKPGARRTTATHAVLWTGTILAAVGGAGLIGFGAAGYATERKMTKGYESEGLSRDELDTLTSRGDALNTAAIISASVGLVGALMAITAYGVEYTNCGPLAPKSRRCAER
ncbi:MAG: hypothetical protein KC420_20560 [Myxococcales bacterium]|nr:hypothetical protein [Myxococcales bacterium]MCB9700450.1 hypothetical protein [Myxococcales bacterium]